MITELDIKTKDAVAVVLRRGVRWLGWNVKRYSYALWLGGLCGAAGWHATSWQYWVAVMPMVITVVWRES